MVGPLRRIRRPSAGFLAGAWFVGLALVVAGPLLGRGYLILLDFPSGPNRPDVSPLPLPSSGDVGNAIPLNAVHALLHAIWRPLPEKLFLLVPIVVGGLGLHRLARVSFGVGPLAGAFGGTLYVINPFVYDRYLAGHLFFVLGYALLPWALLSLVRAARTPARGSVAITGLWLGILAAISFQVAGLYAILVVLVALAAAGRARARVSLALGTAGLGLLLSAYWLLPLFFAPERRVGVADLAAYESRPDGFAIVPTLLAMYGFWRREFVRPAQEQPALYLLLIPIVVLVIIGVLAVLWRGRDRRLGIALAVAGALGVLLGAGTALPPTADLFRWLFAHVPFMGAYREPQKLLALTILAYAAFGTVGLERLSRSMRWRVATAPIAIASVLVYGNAMLWGLSGEVELSRYPASWSQANEVMERRGEGSLLVLPWRLYEDWTFTDARIVANPTRSFFSGREVLAADDAGFQNVPPESVDPFFYYVDDLLGQRDVGGFGSQVAPLGVRFIAWTVEADPSDFQMLSGQADLNQIFFSGDLAIFENRAWTGDVMRLQRIRDRPPPVERARAENVGLVRRFPGWDNVASAATPALAVAKRCTDGWRLGDKEARCHLGAVAAFEAPGDGSPLWRPYAAIQLLGYAISGMALVYVVLAWMRTRKTRAEHKPGPPNTR